MRGLHRRDITAPLDHVRRSGWEMVYSEHTCRCNWERKVYFTEIGGREGTSKRRTPPSTPIAQYIQKLAGAYITQLTHSGTSFLFLSLNHVNHLYAGL